MRRVLRGHEEHAVKAEDLEEIVGEQQVTVVNGIEGPAEHRGAGQRLVPHLAVALYDELRRGQRPDADGPARVHA